MARPQGTAEPKVSVGDLLAEAAETSELLSLLPHPERRVELRRRVHISAGRLAAFLSIDPRTLRAIETGASDPKGPVLERLVQFYAHAEARAEL